MGTWVGLWQEVEVNRDCDLDSGGGPSGINGACIVLERDDRNGKVDFRGYVLGGYRKDKSGTVADDPDNYQVVRKELPASVMGQVKSFLGTSNPGIYLFTPR